VRSLKKPLEKVYKKRGKKRKALGGRSLSLEVSDLGRVLRGGRKGGGGKVCKREPLLDANSPLWKEADRQKEIEKGFIKNVVLQIACAKKEKKLEKGWRGEVARGRNSVGNLLRIFEGWRGTNHRGKGGVERKEF